MKFFGRFKIQDVAAILALAAFSVGLGVWSHSARERTPMPEGIAHPAFSLPEFRARMATGNVLVLDARNRKIFEEGHVPGALSLPVDDFDAKYAETKAKLLAHPERLIIVYCSDMWCGQAEALQQKLINFGFPHVGRFPDGWAAWLAGNLPVEKSP